MTEHVIFAAPFFMEATLRFLKGAARCPVLRLPSSVRTREDRLPADIRAAIAGHWRIDDALDPQQLVDAARGLESRFGKARSYMGPLEQLQVPLAVAREALGIDGPVVGSCEKLPRQVAHERRAARRRYSVRASRAGRRPRSSRGIHRPR